MGVHVMDRQYIWQLCFKWVLSLIYFWEGSEVQDALHQIWVGILCTSVVLNNSYMFASHE